MAKRYTIMLEKSAGSTVRRFRFHMGLLYVGVAACALLLAGLVTFGGHYATLSLHAFDLEQLTAENNRLGERLASMNARVERAMVNVDRLNAINSELRRNVRQTSDAKADVQGQARAPVKRTSPAGGSNMQEPFAVAPVGDDPDVVSIRAELVDGHIDRLRDLASRQTRSLAQLQDYFRTRKEVLDHSPSVWPASGYFTSNFGHRDDPFTGARILHAGIDISNEIGTPIYAPAAGVVVVSGHGGGYGNLIELDHGRGVRTRFGHLSRLFVKVGAEVQRGTLIGHMGNSGRSTGPHLHYEVRVNGEPKNPENYVVEW